MLRCLILICSVTGGGSLSWFGFDSKKAEASKQDVKLWNNPLKAARAAEKEIHKSVTKPKTSQVKRGFYPSCTRQELDNTSGMEWTLVPHPDSRWISKIPATPCGRVGRYKVLRGSVCGLNNLPPILPNSLTEGANVRVLGDRMRALELMAPRNGSIVEIGTLTGTLRRWMLSHLTPTRMDIMDIEPKSITKCNKEHAALVELGKMRCHLGDSKQLISAMPDDSVDLMYVDGDHDYPGVCGDLEAARTKVKPGGLLVLNDYYVFETMFLGIPVGQPRGARWGTYGVIHAANEFILRYKWELVYMTLHPRNEPDLAIRRPFGRGAGW